MCTRFCKNKDEYTLNTTDTRISNLKLTKLRKKIGALLNRTYSDKRSYWAQTTSISNTRVKLEEMEQLIANEEEEEEECGIC